MTDGQTDGQTDARGKTICLLTLKGGDIIINYKINAIKINQLSIHVMSKGMWHLIRAYNVCNDLNCLYGVVGWSVV